MLVPTFENCFGTFEVTYVDTPCKHQTLFVEGTSFVLHDKISSLYESNIISTTLCNTNKYT